MNTPCASPIKPQDMLLYYANGYFPMADQADQQDIGWYNPELRAILPIQDLHIPRNLERLVLRRPYEIRIDTAFEEVIAACGENRDITWLNDTIRESFIALHKAGFAHSVECWNRNGTLVGGLYGLAMGSAFCGESMFSRESNASKVALVHLCARLSAAEFTLLDAQILNHHTKQFGAYEIPRNAYLRHLQAAIQTRTDFSLTGKHQKDQDFLVRSYLSVEKIKKNLTIS